MKSILLLLLLSVLSALVNTEHLIVGEINGELVKHEEVQYNAIPFRKRVKMYFYSQTDNRKIRGIQALDNLHSKASVNITAGGVGHSFVNLRMKSERSTGLLYDIGIYVEPHRYQ